MDLLYPTHMRITLYRPRPHSTYHFIQPRLFYSQKPRLMVTVNSEQEAVAPSPPSYEQSVASEAPPALPVESAPLPPPDAQRVIAPLYVSKRRAVS